MKGVRRGLKSRQQRDQLATLDRGSGENVGSTCREGTPAGPFARPDVRPGGESDRHGWLDFLSPISPPTGPSPDGARQRLSSRS